MLLDLLKQWHAHAEEQLIYQWDPMGTDFARDGVHRNIERIAWWSQARFRSSNLSPLWGFPHLNQFRPHVKPLPSRSPQDQTESGSPACLVDLTTNQAVSIQLLRSDWVKRNFISLGIQWETRRHKASRGVPSARGWHPGHKWRQAMYMSIFHHFPQAPRTNWCQ
jgi:hypothetical protein